MAYRYNLDLPDDTRAELQRAANARGISLAELLRKFIKLGLIAVKTEDDPTAVLIVRASPREGVEEERLLVLL